MTTFLKNIFAFTLIFLIFLSLSSFGQKIDATVRGKILDTDNQVLPGVQVTAKNVATGAESTVFSSAYGRYLFLALPAGVYVIKAELEGFATHVIQDIELKIGQEAIIDITLKLAIMSETIVVTGETPLVEVTKSHMGEVISQQTIDSIPLKGRDFTDLMLLLPGASDNTDPRSGGNISFLGERGYTISYLIDGASNDDDIDGGYVQDFNQDAIQEFEVIPDGYKAEYGKASGGVSNIITKSGTNEFRGRAFMFLRDDSMSWISHEGQVLPKLRRYEYGGTFGGPIKKNKAWFFGSVEIVPEDRGITFVPDRYPIAALEKWVDGWDLGIVPQDRNYTYFGKINATITDKHRITGTFNLNDFTVANEGARFPGMEYDSTNDSYSITAKDTWMISEKSLSEFTFKYIKHNFSTGMDLLERAENGINHGYVRFRLWSAVGSQYTGLSSGLKTIHIQDRDDDRVEAIYSFSRYIEDFHGSHDIKFGADYNHININGQVGQFKGPGQGAFGCGYDDYDSNHPFSFSNVGHTAHVYRDEAISYNNEPNDFLMDVQNHQIGFYLQDSWQIKPGFTINFGVRYDYESLFGDDKNNISPRIGFAWDPWKDGKTVIRASTGIFYDQNLMSAVLNDPNYGGTGLGVSFSFVYPRLGAGMQPISIEWASSYGKDPYTMFGSLTGAYDYFGITYNPNDLSSWPTVSNDNVQQLTGLTPEQFLAEMENMFPYNWSWSYLDGYLQCPSSKVTGPSQVFIPNRPFRTTYTVSHSIGIERKLNDDLAVEIRYNYRRIYNMLGIHITNLMPDGSGGTTDNGPAKIERSYYGWQKIHNVVAAMEKRLSNNFTLMASYAYSWNWTNMPNGIGYRPSNNLDVNEEQGPARDTIPHNFVISGTYFLPYEIIVSGIFRWRSGIVYGPSTGYWDPDADGSGGTPPAEYWPYDDIPNANCFNLSSWKNFDMRIQKNFKFGRYTASFLAEIFNVFNTANVIGVMGHVYFAGGQYQLAENYFDPTNWSRGREIQLGLRFDF